MLSSTTTDLTAMARPIVRKSIRPVGLLICSALGCFGAASTAHASDIGIARLNAQLAIYQAEENSSKTLTTITATANDLVYALYTVLENDPTASNVTVADLAQSALETSGGKTRADKDKIASRVISAAIYGSHAEADPVRVRLLMDAVAKVNPTKPLATSGRAAVVAAALHIAAQNTAVLPADNTDVTKNSGASIAQSTASLVPPANQFSFQGSILKNLAKTGGNNLVAYVNGVLDNLGGDDVARDKNAQTLAASAGASPSIAEAVIAGRAADITNFVPGAADAKVNALVAAAAANTKLKSSVSGVVAGGFSYLAPATSRGDAAVNLFGNSKLKSLAGPIASGALAGSPAPGETTAQILGKIIAASGVTGSKLNSFAGAAAVNNAGVADEIADTIIKQTPASTKDKTNAQAVGVAVIKSIALAAPVLIADAARAVANSNRGIGNPIFPADADKSTLAAGLSKGLAKNYTAAGAAVAGVADTFLTGANAITPAQAAAGFAAPSIKANAKAATAISQYVSELVATKPGGVVLTFATTLAGQVAVGSAGGVAAGVSLTDPNNTGALTKAVITVNSNVQKQALSIANTVATAVDIERVGDVAAAVVTIVPTKNFASLATSLTKALNAKPLSSLNDPLTPNAGWHNRVDEIGELAATIVHGALNTAGGADAKLLAGIGTAIFKAVSQKLLANAGNNVADLKDVANDVAGAIFQTISIAPVISSPSGLTVAIRDALLDPAGTLAKSLVKSAGKFGTEVSNALTLVRAAAVGGVNGLVTGTELLSNGQTGKYEVGNIVDPETPAKNF